MAVLFSCGPLMAALQAAVPPTLRAVSRRPTRRPWSRRCCDEVQPGDFVLVKGSLGSRMGLIVEALTRGHAGAPAAGAA